MKALSGKVVVTGATGFIGRRLVARLLENGTKVIALARDVDALRLAEHPRLQWHRWQFGERLPAIDGISAVFHLAATIPTNFNDASQAARCLEINTLGSLELASQAAEYKVSSFLYFSSGQVYAKAPTAVSEDAATYPVGRATYYLTSKLAGELFVQAAGRTGQMDVAVLRLASVYGPGMHDGGMLPTFIRKLSANERVTVQDGGAYSVDFVYVDDVVEIAVCLAENGCSGIFNAGSGRARTSLDAARIIADALGRDRKLIDVQGEVGQYGFAALNISKAAGFGFTPRSLEDGIAAWMKSGQFTNFSK